MRIGSIPESTPPVELGPLPQLLPATVALYLSASSLTINKSYQELRLLAFPPQTSGLIDLILLATCLIVITIGLLDRSRILHIYHLAAILFVPSVLGRSMVDWPSVLGIEGGLALFSSPLSDLEVLVVGCILVGTFLLHRHTEQSLSDRRLLISLGSSRKEADDVTVHVLLIVMVNILVSALIIVLVHLTLTAFVPVLRELFGAQPGLALPLGLLAMIAVVILTKRLIEGRPP